MVSVDLVFAGLIVLFDLVALFWCDFGFVCFGVVILVTVWLV